MRSDLLLGVGSIPMSTLLQDCWVDGYAPVYALMTRATPSSYSTITAAAAAVEPEEEKVAVGKLRVVLSLEDKGPAKVAAAGTPEAKRGQGVISTRLTPSPSLRRGSRGAGGNSSSSHGQGLLQVTPEKGAAGAGGPGGGAAGLRISERQQQLQQAMRAGLTTSAGAAGAGPTGRSTNGHSNSNSAWDAGDACCSQNREMIAATGAAAAAGGRTEGGMRAGLRGGLPPLPLSSPGDGSQHQQPRSPLRALPQHQLGGLQPPADAAAGQFVGDFRQLPEYLVAWELEVWKKVRVLGPGL